jgi:hypothetical protein
VNSSFDSNNPTAPMPGYGRAAASPERPPCNCDESKALAAELAIVKAERDYLLRFADPKEVRAMQVELAAEHE